MYGKFRLNAKGLSIIRNEFMASSDLPVKKKKITLTKIPDRWTTYKKIYPHRNKCVRKLIWTITYFLLFYNQNMSTHQIVECYWALYDCVSCVIFAIKLNSIEKICSDTVNVFFVIKWLKKFHLVFRFHELYLGIHRIKCLPKKLEKVDLALFEIQYRHPSREEFLKIHKL